MSVSPRHLLIIRLSALGDVAIMAPLVDRYASAHPTVKFTVAGPPMLQPLFEGKPNVEYMGLKKKQSFIKIYKELNAVGADTVVDLHKVNRVGFALTLLRLRHLFDFHFRLCALRKGKLSRWLFIHHWRTTPRKPQIERYEDVFHRAGLQAAPSPRPTAAPSHSQPPTIGIAPFAQHKGKIWPAEYMQQLIGLLDGRGYRVILFGSKEEAPTLERWAEPYANVTSIAGKQSFREELDIIKSLSLMVTMDSANMHFASLVATPVVSIWGATHPYAGFMGWGQDATNVVQLDMDCRPCSIFGNKPCRRGDFACMMNIPPEQVVQKVESILTQNKR